MTAEVIYRPTTVTKLVDPYIDLGNLLLIDTDSPPADVPDSIPNEEELLAQVRDNTQYLFNKIWELERERVDEAICAKLPRPAFRLPREKVIPEKRQLTKWEQYAQAKGIRKRKKDSKVFDETAKEWKPRYGYRRGKDSTKDWLIEIPDHKDPMVDYFAEREEEKKERVHKNELQRLRNIGRSMKARSDGGGRAPLGLSTDLESRTRHELVNQMNRARQATASLGKFQPMLKDEKLPKKTGKTHKFAANEVSIATERKRYLEIFDQIASKKPKIDETRVIASEGNKQENRKTATGKGHDKGGRSRHKSSVHRQQHFQNKIKKNKQRGGKVRRGGKTSRQ
uniref:Ribosome biogenesis regulatory protein n=2 Tax=Parascaris univalens TaxID=6257 RepID=A0A914ZEC4_PARUN